MHERVEVGGRAALHVRPLLGQALADVGHVHDLGELGIEPLHDRRRRVARRDHAIPERDVHLGIAELGKRGHVREQPVALRARGLPDVMWGSSGGVASNIMVMRPAARSMTAGPLPREGTCPRVVPVSLLNSSPARGGAPPLPADENESSPGFSLAIATTSLTDRAGNSALTTMINGSFAIRMTGEKSLTGSY